ncbi:hypothetical protein [Candidatus Finniella inopinata]|uniref:Uncharacterized protein n=1 Tax=Candidatus Finniella inopinata TaxID=1696036 RepID=A0A4Q7DJE5_9PROT|nr:hypothetical protein [Candidatus Finniella inopinata]RZI46154.1 hypothetical protein EQU50_04255 [Candidatus Finniella inopinata]
MILKKFPIILRIFVLSILVAGMHTGAEAMDHNDPNHPRFRAGIHAGSGPDWYEERKIKQQSEERKLAAPSVFPSVSSIFGGATSSSAAASPPPAPPPASVPASSFLNRPPTSSYGNQSPSVLSQLGASAGGALKNTAMAAGGAAKYTGAWVIENPDKAADVIERLIELGILQKVGEGIGWTISNVLELTVVQPIKLAVKIGQVVSEGTKFLGRGAYNGIHTMKNFAARRVNQISSGKGSMSLAATTPNRPLDTDVAINMEDPDNLHQVSAVLEAAREKILEKLTPEQKEAIESSKAAGKSWDSLGINLDYLKMLIWIEQQLAKIKEKLQGNAIPKLMTEDAPLFTHISVQQLLNGEISLDLSISFNDRLTMNANVYQLLNGDAGIYISTSFNEPLRTDPLLLSPGNLEEVNWQILATLEYVASYGTPKEKTAFFHGPNHSSKRTQETWCNFFNKLDFQQARLGIRKGYSANPAIRNLEILQMFNSSDDTVKQHIVDAQASIISTGGAWGVDFNRTADREELGIMLSGLKHIGQETSGNSADEMLQNLANRLIQKSATVRTEDIGRLIEHQTLAFIMAANYAGEAGFKEGWADVLESYAAQSIAKWANAQRKAVHQFDPGHQFDQEIDANYVKASICSLQSRAGLSGKDEIPD